MRLPGGQAGCCQLHFPSDELNFSGRAVAGSGSKSDFFFFEIILYQQILQMENGPAETQARRVGTLNFRGICCRAAFAISDQALQGNLGINGFNNRN